ncbi:MAG: flagellar hook-length control protein FliK, partial [Pseudomonadota bacterium]|nr:flagellar hook-length control protein FliK [Pseudomonadota bacterium]
VAAAAADLAAAAAGATGASATAAGRDAVHLGGGAIAIGRKLGVQPGLDPTARPAPGDTLTSATPQRGPRFEPEQAAQAVLAVAMQPGTPSTPTAVNATASSATLPTPVASPDFPAAFGMQVSALTKDGVQQAQLHLNPAEMGPVSIHIALDGKLAHIDFGADMAATRQAIEASLPALASALRDAGFTLAGGGVAQHSGSDRGGRDEQRSAGSAPAWASADKATIGAIDGAARRQSQRLAGGGIDLFA